MVFPYIQQKQGIEKTREMRQVLSLQVIELRFNVILKIYVKRSNYNNSLFYCIQLPNFHSVFMTLFYLLSADAVGLVFN